MTDDNGRQGMDDQVWASRTICSVQRVHAFKSVAGLCQRNMKVPRAGPEPATSGDFPRNPPFSHCTPFYGLTR
jgi:hypothetical protein